MTRKNVKATHSPPVWGAKTARSAWPVISVVTPSLNQGEYLEACIDSVLSQSYPNVEYIIIDGGSTDNSLEILKKYEKHLTWWCSEPDEGHYHAVQKGLARSSGDIMTWLNSSDLFLPNAFNTAAAIFMARPEIEWLGGRPSLFDNEGIQFLVKKPLPIWHRQRYLDKDYQFIQQEGVFWRRSLWEKSGSKLSLDYSLAADLELWTRFFRYAKFYSCESQLGGFRYHPGQRGGLERERYEKEANRILDHEIQLISRGQDTEILPAGRPIAMREIRVKLREFRMHEYMAPRELNQLAVDFIVINDYATALDLLETAFKKDPDEPRTNEYLGSVHAILNHNEAAIRHYWQAYVREPHNQDVVIGLGLSLFRAGRVAEAKALYGKYLENAPLDEKAKNQLLELNEAIASGKVKEYRVTAIVSTYNAERFLAGCLDNLESQTISSQIEIIVINSGSQQNERDVIARYKKKFDNIVYIETKERETIYAAWNRAIRQARGKYITNANTDDRRTSGSMEFQVKALDKYADIAVVYGNLLVTDNEDNIVDSPGKEQLALFNYPDYSPLIAMRGSLFTCQPMWRHSVHEEFGYFDPTYKVAGDYEFLLKVAIEKGALHIRKGLGLYYYSKGGLEHSNYEITRNELKLARKRYFEKYPLTSFFPLLETTEYKDDKDAHALAIWELAHAALCAAPLPEYEIALECYRRLKALWPNVQQISYNLALCSIMVGDTGKAISELDEIKSTLSAAAALLEMIQANLHDPDRIVEQASNFDFVKPTTQHPVTTAAKTGRGIHIEDLSEDIESVPEQKPLISAIVSTFNAERFITGCLEDLEAQTIADKLEIVVVDAGSPQNERRIVEDFQRRFDNIIYIRVPKVIGVYEAWNIGIRVSKGKYLTSANTDDRHRHDAFERLTDILERNEGISLAYANVWITEVENETFEKHTRSSSYIWADFNRLTLLQGCFVGPQPVWRRDLHEKHGYFDESFKSAGDWEFWLRSSKKEEFLHVNDFLGLYLKSPTSVEHRDKPLSFREFKRVKERYLPYKTELLNRELQEAKQLSQSGEVRQAIQRIRKILDVERNHLLSLEFIGDLCEKIGDTNLALEIWESASQLEPGNERIRNKIQALTQIESLFNAGAHLADKGSLCEGLRLLSRVLDHDPLHVPTLKKMAEVFEKLGLRGKAGEMRLLIKRGQAQKLLFGHLPFEDNNADYGKAHLLIKKGKTTAGLKILSNLLETNPHHIPTLDLMIKLYEDLKLPQKAEAIRKVRLEAGLMKNLKILTGPSDSESDLPVTVVGDWNPDTKRYK